MMSLFPRLFLLVLFGPVAAALRLVMQASDAQGAIKLPIIQIYQNGAMHSEFICGNNVEESIRKLKATLAGLVKSSVGENAGAVTNIYSDSQLLSEISENSGYTSTVLKIFRHGCKKCHQIEPIYNSMAADVMHKWLQAEVDNIPDYAVDLKKRLRNDSTKIDNCVACSNTGFIPCNVCDSTGVLQKGSTAVYCNNCTGYKKVRCPVCGGSCIQCAQ